MRSNIYFFLFSILCAFSVDSYAQAPSIIWQRTLGTAINEGPNDIVKTLDGNLMMCGRAGDAISGNKSVIGTVWFVKMDTSGNILAQYGFPDIAGKAIQIVRDIKATSDSGVVIIADVNGGATALDYGIMKIDKNGVVQFQKQIMGAVDDVPLYVSQTLDGGFVIGGQSDSFSAFDKSENSNGGDDCWIVKLDALGNIEWENTIGGAASDFAAFVHQYSDSTYMIAGTSNSDISGDKTMNLNGGGDIWVLKLDKNGVILSQYQLGGSATDNTFGFATNAVKDLYIACISQSGISGDKTEASFGGMDYWIVKADSTGSVIWQNTVGGSSNDIPSNMEVDGNGNCIVTGRSLSNMSGEKSENSLGSYDYWVMKIDNTGALVWENTIGGSGLDDSRGIVINGDGSCIVSGTSNSPISGDKNEASFGFVDMWILKIAGPGVAPLPLDLLSFEAKAEQAHISLYWHTENMQQVAGFEVEKSADAKSFSNIGYVKATEASNYSYKDPVILDNNFYRLRMIDQDGKYTYSDVVKVVNTQTVTVTAYPNPAKDQMTIVSSENTFSYEITDRLGNVLMKGIAGASIETISIEQLPVGIYYLKIIAAGGNKTLAISKM